MALLGRGASLEAKRTRCNWVQVFSEQTWREFLEAGATVTGFRQKRWPVVKKIAPRDYLLCYISKVGLWIAALEATSEPYEDNNRRVWKDELFPCRVDVRVIIQLQQGNAIPIKKLREELSIFKSSNWGACLLGSPTKFSPEDAAIVLRELRQAKLHSRK
jgi:hypothetical protein